MKIVVVLDLTVKDDINTKTLGEALTWSAENSEGVQSVDSTFIDLIQELP